MPLRNISFAISHVTAYSTIFPWQSGLFSCLAPLTPPSSALYSNRIPRDRQYSSNCPQYSLPFSVKMIFSFLPDSLLALPCNSLKTDSTWSFVFRTEAHNLRLCSYEGHKVLCTSMWLCINLAYICMHDFQSILPPHRRPRAKGSPVLLSSHQPASPQICPTAHSSPLRGVLFLLASAYPSDSCGIASCATSHRLCLLPGLPRSDSTLHASHIKYFPFGHEPQSGFAWKISMCHYGSYHYNLRHRAARLISDSIRYPEHGTLLSMSFCNPLMSANIPPLYQ